jgi:hypothetical protein
MAGDARQRFCTRCALPVHDLSAMNDADALKLLTAPAERVCVRYGVRPDGTVVTGGRCLWIRRVLRAALVAAVSAAFWMVVVLLQRPWQALTRSSAPPAPSSAPSQTEAEQAQLENLLRSINADNAREHKHLGARSSGERDRLRAELRHQRYDPKE